MKDDLFKTKLGQKFDKFTSIEPFMNHSIWFLLKTKTL